MTKISDIIKALEDVKAEYGDIECQIQSNPAHDGKGIVGDGTLFIVPEQYRPEDGGMICNIRSWPY